MANLAGTQTNGFAGIPSLFRIPEVRPQIVDLYRKQKLYELFQWFGEWQKVQTSNYYTPRSQSGFYSLDTTAATSVTGSGTPTVTINGLVAGQSGKAIVGDTVELPAGTQARIQSVTTAGGLDTVVLQSYAAGLPNLTLVAGNVVTQFSNAQEEGSRAPKGRTRGYDYIYNQLGSKRKSYTATDIMKMADKGTLLVNVDGKDTPFAIGAIEAYLQHRTEVASGLFKDHMSDPNFSSTPTVTGEEGFGVQTTRGLVQTIDTYGGSVAVGVAGAPTMADIENLVAKITDNDGPDQYGLIGSKRAIMRLSSLFKGIGATTSPVRINLDNTDRMIDFMVERVVFGDIQFDLASADVFDVTQVVSSTSAVAKGIYAIPMGAYPILSKDGSQTGTSGYINVKYGAVNEPGVGTEMEAEIRLGALVQPPNSGLNVDQTTWCSIVGLDTPKPEALIKLTGVLA